MNRLMFCKKLVPIVALLLLCACLLVDDFGEAWKEAAPDPCLSKIAESLYYAEFRRDPTHKDITALARGWSLGNQHFLLLKKNPDDVGGRLYRFDVIAGNPSSIFRRFRLVPTMRNRFESDYPNAPVSLKHDTVTLATLDAPTKKLLAEISAIPAYWEVEDQVMYNTLHNPTCRFEPPAPKEQPTRKHHDKK